MSSVFERFCYNDVDKPCASFFNCTPCYLTLVDPRCDRIQYADPINCQERDMQELVPSFFVKSDVEIKNCTVLRNQCEEDFDECLEPLLDCIRKCTLDLREATLGNYSNPEGIILNKKQKTSMIAIFSKKRPPEKLPE